MSMHTSQTFFSEGRLAIRFLIYIVEYLVIFKTDGGAPNNKFLRSLTYSVLSIVADVYFLTCTFYLLKEHIQYEGTLV